MIGEVGGGWQGPIQQLAAPRTAHYGVTVELDFVAEMVSWRGPSPYHFLRVPAVESAELEAVKPYVTYGWGVIPVEATIGTTTWTTSLFPKDGLFLIPVKDAVRRQLDLDVGDTTPVRLTLTEARPRSGPARRGRSGS